MGAGQESSSDIREFQDPGTGRHVVQLTSGDCFDYALYYYIPSMTRDGRYVVFYRHRGSDVQLHRLDILSGLTTQLTEAKTANALWRPWLQPPASGVRDQLSAFCPVTNDVFYFDSNLLRCVNIHTLEDRVVYELDDGRVPCGLTGVSPDGQHFVFPHADRTWWEQNLASGPETHTATDCRLVIVDIHAGTARTLVHQNGWITHSHFYDDQRILFSHAPTHRAILMTDLRGGWYVCLRSPDENGMTCHYQATCCGVAYEVLPRHLGICDPRTLDREEYLLGNIRTYHLGRDPEARLWFYEAPVGETMRGIAWLPRLEPGVPNSAEVILGPIRTYWLGQRSHIHPTVTPGRRHILFTGGDDRNETNHLFLLDIADLEDTQWDWPSRHAGRSTAL